MKSSDSLSADLAGAHKELLEARTNYEKGLIKERIRRLAKELEKGNPVGPLTAAESGAKAVEFTSEEEAATRADGLCVRGRRRETIVVGNAAYDAARIADSSEISVPFFRARTSCLISNVENSEMVFSAQQVRLSNCRSLTLWVYTKTGIYLEESEQIVVKDLRARMAHEEEWENCLDVYDFSATVKLGPCN